MKKFLRLAMFLMAFQMEVRVRASGETLLQQPEACLKQAVSCALQVAGEGFHFEKNDVKVHAARGSTLVRQSAKQWRLIGGALWVESGKGLRVETVYATTEAEQGQYWIFEKDSRVYVRNMSASLKVELRDGRALELPEGFEVWIGGLNSKGQTEYGMIEPVNMKELLPVWSSLYRGSKDAFVSEVRHYHDNWGDLTQKSSQLYQKLVERELASVKAREDAEKLRQQRQAAEARRIKELFRQRVFER